ncbi:MAG: very short patch repair endonuclease [Sphingomonadales bacterium]
MRRRWLDPPSAERSRIMRAVKGRNTNPEMKVRCLVHGLGYRYRLYRADLPGTPDLAFPGKRKVVFVHGCFWHGHGCKRGNRLPKANAKYWRNKISRNVQRDAETLQQLTKLGWASLIIWECELQEMALVKDRVVEFLG